MWARLVPRTKQRLFPDFFRTFFDRLRGARQTPLMDENEKTKLIITDLEIGTGKAAVKGALIVCNYEGFLEDGTKFDSSFDHGRPFQFVIGSGRVIKGWDQGLMGMKEGGKRKLFVPAELGYGERQIGKFIKPHSNLIFHVEMIEVRPRE